MGAFLDPIFADRARGFEGPIQYAKSVCQLSEFRVASGRYPQVLFCKLWCIKTLVPAARRRQRHESDYLRSYILNRKAHEPDNRGPSQPQRQSRRGVLVQWAIMGMLESIAHHHSMVCSCKTPAYSCQSRT